VGQALLDAYVAPPFERSALQPPEAVRYTRSRPVQSHGLPQASATTIALPSLQWRCRSEARGLDDAALLKSVLKPPLDGVVVAPNAEGASIAHAKGHGRGELPIQARLSDQA